MKVWWAFLRYAACIDLYMARAGGNKDMDVDAVHRIAYCDRQLDLLEISRG